MLDINFADLDDIIRACNEYGDSDMPFCGKNADDENVVISVFPDKIIVETFQSNGWVRENVYHTDGTAEELYNK